jgi:hypothetical protein
VAHLTEREAIDYLCSELPASTSNAQSVVEENLEAENGGAVRPTDRGVEEPNERTPLLDCAEIGDASFYSDGPGPPESSLGLLALAAEFAGLNALEIAAVAGAKKFLGEKSIQRVINGIWKGDIVFWDTLSTHSVKKAQFYNRNRFDPFCRLRVPLYLKMFEVLFFMTLLAFYYAVLIPAQSGSFTAAEILLYIWLLAFSYNGLDTMV